MSEPLGALLGLRASTADLLQELTSAAWSDAEVAAPSLCEGWTRGHVLTHLARNADAIAGTLSGALTGTVVPLYPDGRDARNAAIDAGAGRPFAVQAADVQDACERLDRVLGAVADAAAWDAVTFEDRPAGDWVVGRWREVEIHRVDLDGGYTPDRWPPLFVATVLPDVAGSLAARATGPLTVTVEADGSLSDACVGTTWTSDGASGSSDAVDVRGPDWAVLAWLVGRGSSAASALTAVPKLGPWR